MPEYSIKAANSDLIKDSISYLTGSASSAVLTLISITFAISKMGLSAYGEAVSALAFYTAIFFICNFEPWQSVIKFNSNLSGGIDFQVIKLSVLIEVFAAALTFCVGYLAVSILAERGLFSLSEGNKQSLIFVFCFALLFMKGTAIGVLRVYRRVNEMNLIIFAASVTRLLMLLLFFDGSAESLFILWVFADFVHSLLLNISAFRFIIADNKSPGRGKNQELTPSFRDFSLFSFKIWLIGRAKGAFANFGVLVLSQVTSSTNVALFSLYQRGLGFITKFTGSFIRALYPIQKELKERHQLDYISFTRQGIERLDYICMRTGGLTALCLVCIYVILPNAYENVYFFIAVVGVCTGQVFVWMSPYQTTLVTLDYETQVSVFLCIHSAFSLMALFFSSALFDVQGAVLTHMMVFLIIALWMRFKTMSGLENLRS